jgi:flagellar biosynthesis regulator FlaF
MARTSLEGMAWELRKIHEVVYDLRSTEAKAKPKKSEATYKSSRKTYTPRGVDLCRWLDLNKVHKSKGSESVQAMSALLAPDLCSKFWTPADDLEDTNDEVAPEHVMANTIWIIMYLLNQSCKQNRAMPHLWICGSGL